MGRGYLGTALPWPVECSVGLILMGHYLGDLSVGYHLSRHGFLTDFYGWCSRVGNRNSVNQQVANDCLVQLLQKRPDGGNGIAMTNPHQKKRFRKRKHLV